METSFIVDLVFSAREGQKMIVQTYVMKLALLTLRIIYCSVPVTIDKARRRAKYQFV